MNVVYYPLICGKKSELSQNKTLCCPTVAAISDLCLSCKWVSLMLNSTLCKNVKNFNLSENLRNLWASGMADFKEIKVQVDCHLICNTFGVLNLLLICIMGCWIPFESILSSLFVLSYSGFAMFTWICMLCRGARASIRDAGGFTALERAMEMGAITDEELFIFLSESDWIKCDCEFLLNMIIVVFIWTLPFILWDCDMCSRIS